MENVKDIYKQKFREKKIFKKLDNQENNNIKNTSIYYY